MEDKEKKPVKLPAVGDIITKTKITSIYGNLGRDTSSLPPKATTKGRLR